MSAGMWSWPCFLFLVTWMLLFALPLPTGQGADSHPLSICYLCFCDIVKWENTHKSWLSMGCISIRNRHHLVGSSPGVDQSSLRRSTARCAVGGALLKVKHLNMVCWGYTGLIAPCQCHRDHIALKPVQKNESGSCAKQYIIKKKEKKGIVLNIWRPSAHPSAITSIKMITIDNIPFTSELP